MISFKVYPFFSIFFLNFILLITNSIHPALGVSISLILIIIFISINNIAYGLFLWVLCHIFILSSSEHIELGEIIFGLFTIFIFLIWLYEKKNIKKEVIINDVFDYSIISFILLAVFSLITALINGNDLLKSFREFIPFIAYLFYFPLKDKISSIKYCNMLLSFFLCLVFYFGIQNIINYKNLILNSSFIWDLEVSRQTTNEPLFFFSLILSFSYLLRLKKTGHKILCILLIIFSLGSLVLTFSRGYWVAALVSFFLLFIFVDIKTKIKMFFYSLLISFPFLLIAYLYLGDLNFLFYEIFLKRLFTILNLFEDPSLLNRANEARELFKLCLRNPLVGYGLGATYSFHNILLGATINTWYSHNAFLFIIFKMGVFSLISIMVFYFKIIKNAYKYSFREYSFKACLATNHKSLNLGVVCSLMGMLPLSFSSPQLIQSNSILIILISSIIINCNNNFLIKN